MKSNRLVNHLGPISIEEDQKLVRAAGCTPTAHRILSLYRQIRSTGPGLVSWYQFGQSVTVYTDLLSLKFAGYIDLTYDFEENVLSWEPLEVPENQGRLHRSYKVSKELWCVQTFKGEEAHVFTTDQMRQLKYAFRDEPRLLQIYLALNVLRGPERQEVNLKALAEEVGCSRHRLILFMNHLEAAGFIHRIPRASVIEVKLPPSNCPMETGMSDEEITLWLTGPEQQANEIQDTIGANGRHMSSNTDTLLQFAVDVEAVNKRKPYIDGRKWRFPASRLSKQLSLWELARYWTAFSRSTSEYGTEKYGYTMYTFEQHLSEIQENAVPEKKFIEYLQANGLLEKWINKLAPVGDRLSLYTQINEIYKSAYLRDIRARGFAGEFEELDEEIIEKSRLLKAPEQFAFWHEVAKKYLNPPAHFLPASLVPEYEKLLRRAERNPS